jgi:enolase
MTASTFRVEDARVRRVLDSRGRPTVEIELELPGGVRARGMAPAGASTGRHEAVDLRDGGTDPVAALDVRTALAGARTELLPVLRSADLEDPDAVDATLEALDRTPGFARLGGNVLIAASFAVRAAVARASRRPLWAAIAQAPPTQLPRPEIQIIGGGAHAAGRLDLQDLMVVPLGAVTFSEGLDRVARIHHAVGARLDREGRFGGYADEGGYWPWFDDDASAVATLHAGIEDAGLVPGEDAVISIDVAASQLRTDGGAYALRLEDRTLSEAAFADWLTELAGRHPIALLEDPFGEDDLDATRELAARLPAGCRIVGDDLVATSAERIEAADGACGAVLVKPNQAGTVRRARLALDAAERCGMMPILSARSGETEDADIAHYAVGWHTPMIKVGALARGERTAKWNELLRISEALGDPPMAPFEA